jgi:hypothetical protein
MKADLLDAIVARKAALVPPLGEVPDQGAQGGGA